MDSKMPNKFAKWVWVAASVVGISISMTMPAQAIERTECEDSDDIDDVVIVQKNSRMCFEEPGEADGLLIADVIRLDPRDNKGYVITNKGIYTFEPWKSIDFPGSVTIYTLSISPR